MKLQCLILVSLVASLSAGQFPAAAQTAAGPTEEEVQKITAAAPEKPTAPPQRPRKLLLFNRNEGFPHTSIPYGAKAVEILGRKTGAFETVVSDDPTIFDPEKLKPFDAIFFNNGYGFTLDEPARQALLDFVQGGKGLVGIHAASANFEGWSEGAQLFGAKFHSHPWTPTEAWAVKNEDPDHPLNAAFGGQGFRVQEEVYTFTDFQRERVHVLLSLDLQDPRTGQVPHPHPFVPISWIHRLGQGRVFFCSLGHVHDLFWTPAILRHYLDGIQFSLGDLEADATPDGDRPFAALREDLSGEVRQPLEAIAEQVREAGQDPARLAHLERQMLQVLRSDAAPEVKRSLCQLLSMIATSASVSAVAPLLSDPELSHAARTVLERAGGPEAAAALRAALPGASGQLKAGVIGSLSHLRDRQAVALLAPLAADPDPDVARAAISALGHIGGAEAARALTSAQAPDPLQPLLDDACAMCADGLAVEGQRAEAETIYLSLAAPDRPPRTRALGLRGLVEMRSLRALEWVLAGLQDPDPQLQRTAARLCASVEGEDAMPKVLAVYPHLPPAVQAVLLAALAERGDAAAAPAALEALKSEDATLRAAALRAVGRLGGPEGVLPLAEIAARGEGEEPQAARQILARLSGEGVEEAFLRLAQAGPPETAPLPSLRRGGRGGTKEGWGEVRAVLVATLADRKMEAARPVLLQIARDPDPQVAVAALKALGRLAGPPELAELVKLLLTASDEARREAAQDALVACARRLGDPDRTLQPLFDALPGASAEDTLALLPVLGQVGGNRALAELARAAASPDPAVKRAAVRTLSEAWEDARPLPTLFDLARTETDLAVRVLALRGILRLLSLEIAPLLTKEGLGEVQGTPLRPPFARGEDIVAQLAEALALAPRPEEKKQVLSLLRECRVPAAVELAAKCLDDPDLLPEAVDAVLYLAAPQRQGNANLRAVQGPATAAALEKAATVAPEEEQRQRAKFLRGTVLPSPWENQDVGDVGAPGLASFSEGALTVQACGADIWGQADGFHFVFQPCSGDVTLVARVVRLENTNEWAKAGVMVRETLQADSANVFLCISPVQNVAFQWRPRAGASAECTLANTGQPLPYWIKLIRVGHRFTGYISPDGQAWQQVGEKEVPMARDVLVGLAVTSHNNAAVTQGVLDSVEVTQGP